MINPDKKKPCKWVQCPLTYISCHHRYEAADKYVCVWKREWKAWVCVFQTNRNSKSQNNGKHQQPQIRVQSWTRRFLPPPLALTEVSHPNHPHTETEPWGLFHRHVPVWQRLWGQCYSAETPRIGPWTGGYSCHPVSKHHNPLLETMQVRNFSQLTGPKLHKFTVTMFSSNNMCLRPVSELQRNEKSHWEGITLRCHWVSLKEQSEKNCKVVEALKVPYDAKFTHLDL